MVGGNSPECFVCPILGGVFVAGAAVACVVEAPALRIVVVQVRVVSELVTELTVAAVTKVNQPWSAVAHNVD